jgi:acetylornithine deacetylase/succinyl-diaminopimelate desuccinylase-like protein
MSAVARGKAIDAQKRKITKIARHNSPLRTTCVATRLDAGHADNALSRRAHATVNCRLLLKEEREFVRNELQKLAGEKIKVTARGQGRASHPTPKAQHSRALPKYPKRCGPVCR